MAWFKRSRNRRSDNVGAEQVVHPAYGLRVGMDRAAIVDRLGRPSKSTASQQVFANHVVIGGRVPDQEYWLYEDVPPGQETRVVVTGDVLTGAEIDAPSAGRGRAKRADMVRIDQDGSRMWRPVDAIKVVSARLTEMPLIDQTQLEAEYEVLREAWSGVLDVGSADEICGRLAADLEGAAAALPGFEGISVGPPEGVWTQLYSFHHPQGEARGHGVAYRIWRIADGRIAMVRSTGKAMSAGEDRVYVVFTGPHPGVNGIHEIVRAFRQDTGLSLEGMPLTSFGTTREPDADFVLPLMDALEEVGRLSPGSSEQMTARSVVVDGARHGVAVIHTNERNPWVRQLIPAHLAKLERDNGVLARRPGWATLSSDSALSFVANAQDGGVRRFDDVHIMVSLFPATEPARIRNLMPGGYTKWVNEVAATAGVLGDAERVDVAHWLLCTEPMGVVVHLGYFSHSPSAVMLPWDLLSAAEQRETPRTA